MQEHVRAGVGIGWYAAPYLSDTAEAVIKLNTAIKAAALQFEKLPKDLSNVAVRSGHGLRLADVQVICRDSVVATMAQLTHHRSTTDRDELRAMLRDMHVQYGVCGQFMVPSPSFATHAGNTWVDRVLRAMGTLRVGLLMPSLVYSCVHAHLAQVQWAGRKWMSQSYTFKGRDICILSEPRTDATVQSLTDPANDLLHARLPCLAPGHWVVQLQECHEDHLHLPHAGVGPHQLDHVWLTGLHDVFRPQLPGPLTHRLIHPLRRKKASKRNRQSAAGDVYVVGGYREEGPRAQPRQGQPLDPYHQPLPPPHPYVADPWTTGDLPPPPSTRRHRARPPRGRRRLWTCATRAMRPGPANGGAPAPPPHGTLAHGAHTPSAPQPPTRAAPAPPGATTTPQDPAPVAPAPPGTTTSATAAQCPPPPPPTGHTRPPPPAPATTTPATPDGTRHATAAPRPPLPPPTRPARLPVPPAARTHPPPPAPATTTPAPPDATERATAAPCPPPPPAPPSARTRPPPPAAATAAPAPPGTATPATTAGSRPPPAAPGPRARTPPPPGPPPTSPGGLPPLCRSSAAG